MTIYCGLLTIYLLDLYRTPDQISFAFLELVSIFGVFVVGCAYYCDQCPPSPSPQFSTIFSMEIKFVILAKEKMS